MGSRNGIANLSTQDRKLIEELVRKGKTPNEIGELLGRHHTTIRKELKRGVTADDTGSGGTKYSNYSWRVAQASADEVRGNRGMPRKHIPSDAEIEAVMGYIRLEYAPYAALELAKKDGYDIDICVRTLYNYIHSGEYSVTEKDLLRPPKASENQDASYHGNPRVVREGGESIANRPSEISSRESFGHWEAGFLMSPPDISDEGLFLLVERLSRYGIAFRIKSKTQTEVVVGIDRIEDVLGSKFTLLFKTLTMGNGVSEIDYQLLETSYFDRSKSRFKTYYANEYHGWERGSVEHFKGMLRRKLPPGTAFSEVSESTLSETIIFYNGYPRKELSGNSASIVFNKHCSSLGISPADVLRAQDNGFSTC